MTKDGSKISANVLEMKFMRRTKQRLEEKEKRKLESDLQKAYLAGETIAGNDKSRENGPSSDRFVFTHDLEFLEDLQYGRMSFKGSNPQVERLMKYFTDKKNGIANDSDDEKDVSDDEMTDTMGGSLSRTIQEKFKTKANKRDHSLVDESAGDKSMKKRRMENNGRRY